MKRQLVWAAIGGLLIAGADLWLKSHISPVIYNSGSFLGIALPNILLLVLHFIIFGAGVWLIVYKVKLELWRWWGAVVLFSSLSNLADRIRVGAVADYLSLLGIWFNLADLTVTLALAVAVFVIIRKYEIHSTTRE